MTNSITVSICTFNGANRLPELVNKLRQQKCSIPFEILVVDNNSTDNTQQVLRGLSASNGAILRTVIEKQQGITYARNRAIEESMGIPYMAFIDDDELPGPYWLQSAVDALDREGAECVGGEIRVHFPSDKCPAWMTEEILGFLGQVKNGQDAFWITDRSTPVWSGNVAYRTSLFKEGLRFDHRYNRQRQGIGGGSDGIMFRQFLEMNCRIRYRPDMMINHLVGIEKFRKSYFLRLHFIAGRKLGQYETGEYSNTIMGVPPFMVIQALRQWGTVLWMFIRRDRGVLRQAMNGSHAIGMILGRFLNWRGLDRKK
jgi:glycosyltransferase involved in cell wall biosynthesis